MQCDLRFSIYDFRLEEGLSGSKLAEKVMNRFHTNSVDEIARTLGISIVYEKWFPITLGEFDRKNRRITVNENATIPFETIIAHELGHYFLEEFSRQRHRDAEKICDEFADELLAHG
jgi:Zn-dependent peptidase ImmA (M78 family)